MFICGCRGLVLAEEEQAFFSQGDPWGFILFGRNIADLEQLCRLVDALRDTVGRNAPVLIDQEGGRVVRLGPPHWHSCPAARQFGRLAERDFQIGARALKMNIQLIAQDVAAAGMDAVCLPVLDIPLDDGHEVIGDRAYGTDVSLVSRLGKIAASTLLDRGLLPVAKHVPGHGRATLDSHDALPVVSASREELMARDFAPFCALADVPMMMTAHILYTALDESAPATFSSMVIRNVIREHIGFDGLLISDDVSMGALSGAIEERGRIALGAGCDMLLHCNADMREMETLAQVAPLLSGKSKHRADRALALRHRNAPAIPADTRENLEKILLEASLD